jgi:hypothetical protein
LAAVIAHVRAEERAVKGDSTNGKSTNTGLALSNRIRQETRGGSSMEDLLFFSREREPVALGSLLSGGAAPPEAPPLVVADTPLGRRRERKLRQRAGAGATLAMSTACGRKNVAVAVTATWVFLLPAYAPTYPRAARERAGGERARERRAELDEKVGATLPIISDQNTAILGGVSRVRTASEEGGAGVDNCKRVARTVVRGRG